MTTSTSTAGREKLTLAHPLPFTAETTEISNGYVTALYDGREHLIADYLPQETAEFIARACNAYAPMLNALRAVAAPMAATADQFPRGRERLHLVEAALALAEGR